jgi:hypothetical protein
LITRMQTPRGPYRACATETTRYGPFLSPRRPHHNECARSVAFGVGGVTARAIKSQCSGSGAHYYQSRYRPVTYSARTHRRRLRRPRTDMRAAGQEWLRQMAVSSLQADTRGVDEHYRSDRVWDPSLDPLGDRALVRCCTRDQVAGQADSRFGRARDTGTGRLEFGHRQVPTGATARAFSIMCELYGGSWAVRATRCSAAGGAASPPTGSSPRLTKLHRFAALTAARAHNHSD